MRDLPSTELLDLFERLRLLAPARVRSVASRVRKLAGNLPKFDSVWVDALAQSHLLTAYQAREINAGRGDQLAIGPYLVRERILSLGYADVFLVQPSNAQDRWQARRSDDLVLMSARIGPAGEHEIRERLVTLQETSQSIESPYFRPIREVEIAEGKAWMVSEYVRGVRAGDWIVENGRFPPLVVLDVARQMLVGLCELERLGLPHGDLHVRNLVIGRDGVVVMPFPGVRSAIRPHEGFSMVDLPPHCYETLAPERVLQGTPPTIASELFACGCVWWQMLTGRPALAGGNALAKLKAAAEARIPDVRQLAPDAPPVLAEVIASCTAAKIADRPASFVELARLLGPPGSEGSKQISRTLKRPERWLLPRPKSKRKRGRLVQHALEVAAAAACIFATLAAWRLMVHPAAPQVARARQSGRSISRERIVKSPTPPLPPALSLSNGHSPTHRQAAFVEPVTNPKREVDQQPAPLRLPTDRVVRLASLSPTAGQIVCGEDDRRATVVVPRGGLVVDLPDVRFQGVDFVCGDGDSSSPMIVLRAPTARFESCTFRGPSGAVSRSAIAWQPVPSDDDDWDAAVDHVSLVNCVVHQVSAVIDRTRATEATIECTNLLHVESGSLVRLPQPAADSPVAVSLVHCTLRSTGPAVELLPQKSSAVRIGRVTVTAVDCVLAPQSERALIELAIEDAAENVDKVRWTGKDSLLEVRAGLIAKRDNSDSLEPLDESRCDVTGLARSPLDFAGRQLDLPATSQLRRWLAPRQSLDPPGIIAKELPEFTGGANLTSRGNDLDLQ